MAPAFKDAGVKADQFAAITHRLKVWKCRRIGRNAEALITYA